MIDSIIPLSPEIIIETAKKGIEAIKDLYTNSDPEQRILILKILGGVAGFSGFIKFQKSL